MSTEVIIAITVAVFIILMALETPVAFSLLGSGALGLTLLVSGNIAMRTVSTAPYEAVANYTLAIIPLYILLGMVAVHGRLAERVYGVAAVLLRFLPGGLGVATVAACAGFAAVSGSSVATAASIGKISVGEMRRNGYSPAFATGIVAIGGTLGILIPPSVAMVMYGIVAEESIGQLLVAGIIPGVLSAAVYGIYIMLVSRKHVTSPTRSLNETVLEAAGRGSAEAARPGRPQLPKGGVRAFIWLALIFVAVIGGMFSGLLTVTESAAFGALIAVLMLFSENFRSGLKDLWRRLSGAAQETGAISSMAFMLLIGATVFSTFMVMSRAPYMLAGAVADLDVPPIVIVIVILLILIPLGMFLETLSILIIVVPLVHPMVIELGFSGIWFAVLFVMMLEIGLITPPVGMNVFVVSAATKVPLETAFRGVVPFLIPALAIVALVMIFPQLATWLPSLLTT